MTVPTGGTGGWLVADAYQVLEAQPTASDETVHLLLGELPRAIHELSQSISAGRESRVLTLHVRVAVGTAVAVGTEVRMMALTSVAFVQWAACVRRLATQSRAAILATAVLAATLEGGASAIALVSARGRRTPVLLDRWRCWAWRTCARSPSCGA